MHYCKWTEQDDNTCGQLTLKRSNAIYSMHCGGAEGCDWIFEERGEIGRSVFGYVCWDALRGEIVVIWAWLRNDHG